MFPAMSVAENVHIDEFPTRGGLIDKTRMRVAARELPAGLALGTILGPAVAAAATRDPGKERGGAMGHWQSFITPERQLRAQRAQQMSLIYTVMVCLASLIFVQFLLLTVALEGYLGGRVEVALPTALVSGLCCAAAYWLLRYILLPGRG